jgi:hypothetical protein
MTRDKNRDSENEQQVADLEPEEKPEQKLETKGTGNSKSKTRKKEVPERENRNLKREEYNRHINLFKFYCDIALKANLYFYLITGGITSFYFSALSQSNNSGANSRSGPMSVIEVSFLLPIFMSAVLGGVFFYGRHLWSEIVETVAEIRDELSALGLSIKKTPEVGLLASLLLIFGSLFFLVGSALTVLMAVQMKNSGVWSSDKTWGGLFNNPKSYLILLPAIVIIIAGIILPYQASWINWMIKRLRKHNRRKLIKRLRTELQGPELNDANYRFKDSFLYHKLLPYLSEGTIKNINTGKLKRSLIERDLKKLEKRWKLNLPAISTNDQK